MTDVDRELARADALLERTRARHASVARRARRRTEGEVLGRLARIAVADALIVVGAILLGLFVPLGIMGALLVAMLLVATTLLFALMPIAAPPSVERLGAVPIAALPVTTERWLETQRLALPAPARTLADSIGVKLEVLAPQLAAIPDDAPAAAEIRKLLSEDLTALVSGYAQVPQPLRGVARNGMTPDQQLAHGLEVIDEELGEMSERLALGNLDALATRGRYLQIKYRDEELG